jgi:hypothetical protein
MNFLAKLLLGNGTLKPQLRAALESEGLVALEEGLPGSLRYRHFKSPGRRFHGKVTPQRIALGISKERIAVYCRSGRTKLMNSPFTEPRLKAVEVSLLDNDTVSIRIDFDRADVPKVSGEIEIRAETPNAANIVEQLQARLRRQDP